MEKENARIEEVKDDNSMDNRSPIERELSMIIEGIINEMGLKDSENVKVALSKFKAIMLDEYINKYLYKIATLESLVSLIGAQDERVMQLLTYIDSTK